MAKPKGISFGVHDDRGVEIQPARRCALTGASVVDGSVKCPIPGTNLFYRLSPSARKSITPAQREELTAKIIAAAADSVPVVSTATAQAVDEEAQWVDPEKEDKQTKAKR